MTGEQAQQMVPLAGALLIDGRQVALEQAHVSAFDRGFVLGDSVFEVMRTYGGRPCFGTRHLRRLFRSCERILLAPPVSIETLRDEVMHTIAASKLPECYLRIIITRGRGPMHLELDPALAPQRLIYALPLRTLPLEAYSRGMGLRMVHGGRGAEGGREVGAKASNYLANLLATHDARGQGAHEALFVSPLGEILEGATSNVFVVTDGVVRTPPSRSGILEGITRGVVQRLVRSIEMRMDEMVLFPGDIYRAREVFITSSLREVVPVVKVDDVAIGDGRPGPVTRELMRRYRAQAEQAGWDA